MKFSLFIAAAVLVAACTPSLGAYAADGSRTGKSRIVRRHHRPYIATAITGPVLQTSRPGTAEPYRVFGPAATHTDDGPTLKDLQKQQRRQTKAIHKAQRIAQRDEAQRVRQQKRALGQQLVAHHYGNRRRFR